MAREYQLKKSAAPPPSPASGGIDFVAELNKQQLAVVKSPPGASLVIAGAGSGKTRTLTYRVAYLLENAIHPTNILLLTFTNKAAREMMERVESLIPGRSGGMWGGTFHSICNRILRRHPTLVGLSAGFTILDSEDQKSLLSKVIKESGVATEVEKQTGKKFPKAPVILGLISLATNTRAELTEVIEAEHSSDEHVLAGIEKVAALYVKRKEQANAVDFDDLMLYALRLFNDNPKVLKDYQYQFQFILVDEYQDTNALQGELVTLLAGQHGNIMAVGDDAQSIYSWRGADFRYIIDFPKRYPNARVYRIETNYRSVPEVLELANESIKANVDQFEKKLQATRDSAGMRPAVVGVGSPAEQAMFVSQRIEELAAEGIPYSEMAVLYRAHFQSMEVQMQLTSESIPYTVTSGLKFFEQAHIKDFSAFLKFAVNPLDESSFDRLVKMIEGIGDVSAGKIFREWRAQLPALGDKAPLNFSSILLGIKVPTKAAKDWEQLAYTLDELVDGKGGWQPPEAMMKSVFAGVYEDYMVANFDNAEQRQQDLDQFMRFGERFATVQEMLSDLSLLSGPEAAEANPGKKTADAVTLSSIHQAKGLEWKVVFVIWLTAAMFPNPRAVEEGGNEALEEERRLFYVAVTRAMDQLYLTYPRMWHKAYNGEVWQTPSVFLAEIPPATFEEWKIGGSTW
jgi:DNA helicase-2/ATP-dependent DNA helicase PcrA